MPSEYPSRWNTLRDIVYRRDNYRCANCGEKGGPYGNAELHAHHIVPKSAGGRDITNKDNLVTLCGECHNFAHGGRIRGMCNTERNSGAYIIENRDYDCQNCGERVITEGETFMILNSGSGELHYIVPLKSGGKKKDGNIALLCRSCHQKSHT